MSIRKTTLLVALTTVIVALHTAIAPASITQIGSFGTTGSGTLKGAEGIAVNANTNNVYVADKLDHRVVEYDQEGNFILTFGREVNETKVQEKQKGDTSITETEENICTAASGNTCTDGTEGTQPGQLDWPTSIAIDPNTRDVYVSDGGNERIEKYTSQGEYISQIVSGQNGAPNFTVGTTYENYLHDTFEFTSLGNGSWADAEGNFYLSVGLGPHGPLEFTGAVYKFAPDGEYTGAAALAPSRGIGEDRWGSAPDSVVVGPGGRVYVSEVNELLSRAVILAFEGNTIASSLPAGAACEKAHLGEGDPLAVNLFTGEVLNVYVNGACEVVGRALTASGGPVMEFHLQGETYESGGDARSGDHPYVYQAIAYGTGVGKLYQLTGGGGKSKS